jgi:hypothetical protein
MQTGSQQDNDAILGDASGILKQADSHESIYSFAAEI